MRATENGHSLLSRFIELLLSFPFDLKVLQEVVTDEELPETVREQAVAMLLQAFGHRDGSAPERFFEDVVLLRLTLGQMAAVEHDHVESIKERFCEVFALLDEDLAALAAAVPADVWEALKVRARSLSRLLYKGKRPIHYVLDENLWDDLYEEGLEFQTAYNVNEEQVRNRFRRFETCAEVLCKRVVRPKQP